MSVQLFVHGIAKPQGSKTAYTKRGGGVIVTSSSKGLPGWRRVVRDQAQRYAQMHDGPVVLDLYFLMPRPKSLPKRRHSFKITTPDLSKTIRAVEDSLKGIMWPDDNRVIHINAHKRYTDTGGPVGVAIKIRLATEEDDIIPDWVKGMTVSDSSTEE